MRIGADAGPGKIRGHETTYVAYDVRTGRILATHHVIDAGVPSEEDQIKDLTKLAHETSRVPLDHIVILKNPHLPSGEGAIRVDDATKRLVRSAEAGISRVRP
jgi:hypothetical protein